MPKNSNIHKSAFYTYDISNGIPCLKEDVVELTEQQGATLFLVPVKGLCGQPDTLTLPSGEVYSGSEILQFINSSLNRLSIKEQ